MKYIDQCNSCGHIKAAYTQHFNKNTAKAFEMFAEKYLGRLEPLKKADVGLSNSQYTNFQNLRYFGIIEQVKGQRWIVTPLGEAFYNGNAPIKNPAGHIAGITLDDAHPAWATHKGKRKELYLDEIHDPKYKQRDAFAAEKNPVGTTVEV